MRLRSLVALTLACSVHSEYASAQASGSLMIRGRVVGADGAPIIIAEALSLDGAVRARTDERGEFRLRLPAGTEFRVRALGYREQRVRADSTVRVQLDALPMVLDAMTTTVGGRALRANETTRSVTVIERRQLDAAAAISANQVLRQIPGLQEIAAPPSKSSISIRGFDDNRVLVLVDGEPVTGGLIDSRDIGRLSTLAAERIEVTKGPSSVEFGSDAIGGVINLVQAAPTADFTASGLLRSGGLGRSEGTAEASQMIGRFGYRVGGGWRQVDRLPGLNTTGSTFNRVYDLRADLRVQATDRLSFRLNATGTQERQRWPVDNVFNGFIDNRGGQGFVEAQYSGFGGSLRARAFEQRFQYQYRQSRGLLPIAGSADSLEQRERQGRYLVAYTRAAGRHTIDAGIQHSSRKMVSPGKVDGDSAQDAVTEFFAREQLTAGPFLFTAGARHSNSSLWGSSTNPSLGLAWQAAPTVRLRTNVARGFRAPGFKEMRYTFSHANIGYALYGNTNLTPETSVSSALGVSWAPAPAVVLDVEGYRNDVRDMIEVRYIGMNTQGLQEYRYINVSEARTAGLEASVRTTLRGYDVGVGYDWVQARDLSTGLPLSKRAAHTARANVSRQFLRVMSGLSTDVSARYTGRAPIVGNAGTGGTHTGGGIDIVGESTPVIVATQGALLSIDGQLRLAPTSFSELSLGVTNLLDQRPAMWTPAFARQVFAGVRLLWGGQPSR